MTRARSRASGTTTTEPASAGCGRPHGQRHLLGPARPRQRRPHGAWAAAVGQRGQEGGPGVVPVPGPGLGPARRRGRLGRGLRLDAGVPGRQGQAQDVGQRARAPVGDRARHRQQLGGRHLLRAHDGRELGQRARVVRGVGPLEQPAVDEPPGEAHPHPDARLRVLRHGLGHGVVEGPVEVRQPGVDGDPCDGLVLRQDRGPGGRARPLPEGGPRLPDIAHVEQARRGVRRWPAAVHRDEQAGSGDRRAAARGQDRHFPRTAVDLRRTWRSTRGCTQARSPHPDRCRTSRRPRTSEVRGRRDAASAGRPQAGTAYWPAAFFSSSARSVLSQATPSRPKWP